MGVMPVERHRRCGDQEDTIARLQAELAAAAREVAVLRTRVLTLGRMVAAQQEAAPQIREDGRAEGYAQAAAEGHAGSGRHRRPPEARWLRAVPAVLGPVLAVVSRPARHKLLAGAAASAALVAAAAAQMNLAPWIAGTGPSHRAPAVVKAFTPHPGKGGGGVLVPPRGKPSSPPGRPAATPTGTPAPAGTGTVTASPSPGPADTSTASPEAAVTPGPDPGPSATATACPAPGTPGHQ